MHILFLVPLIYGVFGNRAFVFDNDNIINDMREGYSAIALNVCFKPTFQNYYYKYTCSELGDSVIRSEYSNSDCSSANPQQTTFSNSETSPCGTPKFECGIDAVHEYATIKLYFGTQCAFTTAEDSHAFVALAAGCYCFNASSSYQQSCMGAVQYSDLNCNTPFKTENLTTCAFIESHGGNNVYSKIEHCQRIPTNDPSYAPHQNPTLIPTDSPFNDPTPIPSSYATTIPSSAPTSKPSSEPTSIPSSNPTSIPSSDPTSIPSSNPTSIPSSDPTSIPSSVPTTIPSSAPTSIPLSGTTSMPSSEPPSSYPTSIPLYDATSIPSSNPTPIPSFNPTAITSISPTLVPSKEATHIPTPPTIRLQVIADKPSLYDTPTFASNSNENIDTTQQESSTDKANEGNRSSDEFEGAALAIFLVSSISVIICGVLLYYVLLYARSNTKAKEAEEEMRNAVVLEYIENNNMQFNEDNVIVEHHDMEPMEGALTHEGEMLSSMNIVHDRDNNVDDSSNVREGLMLTKRGNDAECVENMLNEEDMNVIVSNVIQNDFIVAGDESDDEVMEGNTAGREDDRVHGEISEDGNHDKSGDAIQTLQ